MLEMVKRNKEILVICMLYGIILLAVFAFIIGGNVPPPPSGDGYDKIGQYLLSDAFFTSNGVSANYNRTPGYPFFLAAIYFLGGNNATVVIVHILLTVVSVYLFYSILIMQNVPKRLSLFGTVLLLCYFSKLVFIFIIYTEVLFGFLLLLSLYFLVYYIKNDKNTWGFLVFSLSLNYALLVRPILMYFNMLVCLALLIAFILKKIQLKCFVLFTLCFTVIFGGWSYRNYLHSGIFVFSTISKSNTQEYYAPIITARIKNIKEPNIGGFIEGATDYHEEMFLQEYPEVKGGNLNDVQIAILQGKYGSQFIKNNFSEYIKANTTGFFRMMLHPGFGGGRSQFIIQRSIIKYMNIGLSLLSLAYIVIVYLIYLAGLVTVFKKRDFLQIGIFLLCGYLAIPGAIFANIRFRDPFFPLLLLSAVSNSGVIIQWLSQKLRIPFLQRMEKFLLDETEAGD
jgi:hypothetical protein